jgi:hypothetical protein
MAEDGLAGWYDRLMAVNAEAFAAGNWEAAYHALMAALHCAADLRDAGRLAAVSDVARGQQAAIDAKAPGHALSSRSAGVRGHKSLLETAAFMADTRVGMLRPPRPAGRAAR